MLLGWTKISFSSFPNILWENPHKLLGQLNISWASQVMLVVKDLPSNEGDIRDVGLIPGKGSSPGKRHGKPLQYSCLVNPMDRGGGATVHSIAKRQT